MAGIMDTDVAHRGLLVDPAVAVERLADLCRGHRRVLRQHQPSLFCRGVGGPGWNQIAMPAGGPR